MGQLTSGHLATQSRYSGPGNKRPQRNLVQARGDPSADLAKAIARTPGIPVAFGRRQVQYHRAPEGGDGGSK